VCETASQLLGHPDVVTVLIGDMDLIESAADARYAASAPTGRQLTSGVSIGHHASQDHGQGAILGVDRTPLLHKTNQL